MRKFFTPVTAFLVLASCNTRDITPLPAVVGVTEIVADAPSSRTILDGNAVCWTSSDRICVNGVRSNAISIQSPTSAKFTFPSLLNTPYRCVSPASSSLDESHVCLPSVQNYSEGTYDEAAACMLGYSDGKYLSSVAFHHAMSYLRVTVLAGSHNEPVRKIIVEALGGENLSGTFEADFQNSSLEAVHDEGESVTCLAGAGMPLGSTATIAIPARAYESGIKLRIVDVNNHYQDVVSRKAFPAQAGKVYSTTLTFNPTGTMVDTGIGEGKGGITPYYLLNSAGHSLNSHAGQTSRSHFTFVGNSFRTVGKSATLEDMAVYPRFIKTKDGRFLMFFHNGSYNANSGKYSWSGTHCRIAESVNMLDWTLSDYICPPDYDVSSPYGDKITRTYSGIHPVRLADGNLLVVSAYRAYDDYRHRVKDNGLAVQISTDDGFTWGERVFLNVGTNWEPLPLVLPEGSAHPGRVIIYYTDSCPYYEGVWSSNIVSTGISYVYSDDNGKTWKPDDMLNNHLNAYRYRRDEKDGNVCFTDQMPAVINLNGTKRLMGAGESNRYGCEAGDKYWVSVVYGDSEGGWDTPDHLGNKPRERNDVGYGMAPYLVQFPSGEVVLCYNSGGFLMRTADETGHNISDKIKVFGARQIGTPFWGSMLVDGHILLAGIGGAQTSGSVPGTGFGIQVGQYYLNHNISASTHSVKVDGENSEWKNSDEALFIGSNGDMHGTVRCSVVGDMMYFLVEVENSSLHKDDYLRIYLCNPSSSVRSDGDVYLHIKPDGSLAQKKLVSLDWASVNLGAVSAMHLEGRNYITEISIPLSSLPTSSSQVLVDVSCRDSVDGSQTIVPTSSTSTATWPRILW